MKTYKQHRYVYFLMIQIGLAAIFLTGAGPAAAQTCPRQWTFAGGAADIPGWTYSGCNLIDSSGNVSMQCGNSATYVTTALIDAASYSGLSLSFNWWGVALNASDDDFIVEASLNGTTWTTLTCTGNVSTATTINGVWNQATCTLPATFDNTSFYLRFDVDAVDNNEELWIDNVNVCQSTSTPTPTPTPTQPGGGTCPRQWDFADGAAGIPGWTHNCNLIDSSGNVSMHCGSSSTAVTTSQIDAAGYSGLYLSFNWWGVALNASGDDFIVEASLNNTTWTTLTCTGNVSAATTTNGVWNQATCPLPATYDNTSFYLRFDVDAVDNNEELWLDNVNVCQSTSTPTPTPTPTQPGGGTCPLNTWTFDNGVTGWTITGCNNLLVNGNTSLHCGATTVTAPAINAAGYSGMCVRFNWWGVALNASGDDFIVEASLNNTTWTTLTCTGNVSAATTTNGVWNQATCPLPATYDNTTFYLRFDVSAVDNNEELWIDNVSVCEDSCSAVPTSTPDGGGSGIVASIEAPSMIVEGETTTAVVKVISGGPATLTLCIVPIAPGSSGDLTGAASSTGSLGNYNTATGSPVFNWGLTATQDTVKEPREAFRLQVRNGDCTNGTVLDEDIIYVEDNDLEIFQGTASGFPTFLFTVSYDWLHHFTDRNAQHTVTTTTDPDTDNFNKIIMMDSNLFPIYTAIYGDQEFPNVVMRNWAGADGTAPLSPNVNDYMNRSVAAAANYINTTTQVPILYGGKLAMKAIGARSYLQWVYAIDPGNNNFRRYKFIKVADRRPTYMNGGIPGGDVAPSPTGPGQHNVGDCPNCSSCSWYYGEAQDVLCGGTGKEPACCPSTAPANANPNASCIANDDLFLFAAKRPGDTSSGCPGGNAVSYPACDTANFPPPTNNPTKVNGKPLGAPGATFEVSISEDNVNGADVTVVLPINGFSHDTSGMAFVLNNGGGSCQSVRVFSGNDPLDDGNAATPYDSVADNNAAIQANDFNLAASEPTTTNCNTTCLRQAYVEFIVPLSCATEANNTQTMTVDVYPCGGSGWVLKIPQEPAPQDNAFRIPVPGVDVDPDPGLTPEQIQTLIDRRWVNISTYLNTVPPKSYPGYRNYSTVGYGFQTNTSFTTAKNVRFKDPRDIDVYRDYFDAKNGAPVYIFVADTMNSRIQVFMNATGSAGDVTAPFPIRPVRVRAPNDSATTAFKSNELAARASTTALGDGRKGDWRNYTTVSGAGTGTGGRTLDNQSRIPAGAGRGDFYYPHSVAVDQDPDTKDIYLFVADTYNHRIQVFRDISGVSSQAIGNKRFDFQYAEGWGSYPLQTTLGITPPGPFTLRYPKGIDVVRYANNSSLLYVVDSKNYRLLEYRITEGSAAQGIVKVELNAAYGSAQNKLVNTLFAQQGAAVTAHNVLPGFLNPQDVATGYSGFYLYTGPRVGNYPSQVTLNGRTRGVRYLNNYMVYVTDYARNNTSISRARLNMRVQQFIRVPTFGNISGEWIPWETENVRFGTWTSNNLPFGQSVFGADFGLYSSVGTTGAGVVQGSSNNAPGRPNLFTERPASAYALQWNSQKPIDIRVIQAATTLANVSDSTTGANVGYVNGDSLPRTTPLRIGVSSRFYFKSPENKAIAFLNSSTEVPPIVGRWDGLNAGRVHLFCYDKFGMYQNHTALHKPPYLITLSSIGTGTTPPNATCPTGGFLKVVAEDKDFPYSARTGTIFFQIGN